MVENQPNLWLPRIALPAAEYSHSNRQYSVMICSQLGPAHVPHCKLHQTYLETDGADDGVECSYPNDANCDHDSDEVNAVVDGGCDVSYADSPYLAKELDNFQHCDQSQHVCFGCWHIWSALTSWYFVDDGYHRGGDIHCTSLRRCYPHLVWERDADYDGMVGPVDDETNLKE